jgi:hypothetical protein
MKFNSATNIKDALNTFYKKNDFGADGGANKKTAKIKIGRWNFIIPNTQGRKRALIFHDIHHIVAEYNVNFKGETHISGWEIGSSCKGYITALFLNLMAFTAGLFLHPKGVYKSFVRGRHSQNLYHNVVGKKELLKMNIEEIQTLLKLNLPYKRTTLDVFFFVLWIFISLAVLSVPYMLYLLVFMLI